MQWEQCEGVWSLSCRTSFYGRHTPFLSLMACNGVRSCDPDRVILGSDPSGVPGTEVRTWMSDPKVQVVSRFDLGRRGPRSGRVTWDGGPVGDVWIRRPGGVQGLVGSPSSRVCWGPKFGRGHGAVFGSGVRGSVVEVCARGPVRLGALGWDIPSETSGCEVVETPSRDKIV